MTKPFSGPSCFHVPLQITLTKGEGQAVAPLSPRLWEPPAAAHAAELGPCGSQWLLPKHTQTHQDVSLFRQVLTLTHYQLRRHITGHCEDWGGRYHGLLKPPRIIGSLGDICSNCLLLLPRQSQLKLRGSYKTRAFCFSRHNNTH